MYRFVSLGVTSPLSQRALDAGRIGVLTDDGLGREIVAPDGSVESRAAHASEALMGAVPVPARLGGGFLFWGNTLYRAASFTGPLEAITAIPTNVLGVEFGPNFVLTLLPESPPRAFALGPPRALPLSPHGLIDVAATDDGRAVALDATGRAFATTDAGKSWKDVTAAAGAVQGVRSDGSEVAFVSSRTAGAWLQKDGQLVQRPFATAVPISPERKSAELLRRAFVAGLPLPGGRIVVGEGSGTRIVDMQSGSASALQPAGPEGSSCTPVSLDDEGIALCISYASKGTSTVVVSHALGASPVLEKTFAGAPQFLPGRTLAVIASCVGAHVEGAACVRRDGAWVEVDVSAELLRAWQPRYWVPLEGGGVDVIVGERDARGHPPRVALIDPAASTVTPWDTTLDRVTPNDRTQRPGSSLAVLADGTVRGFTTTRTVRVDAKGHASPGGRTFASISSAGAHALARDDAEHLWQTSDYGAHWVEIAPPPFDSEPEGIDPKVNPRPSGRASGMACSPLGCALEHSSGTGVWLRAGWPEEPPHTPGPASASASAEGAPSVAAPIETAEPSLPTLHCLARAAGAFNIASLPHKTPEPRAGEEWTEVFGGRLALARRRPLTFANIAFRDVFSGEQTFVRYGLRAAVSMAVRDGEPLSSLIARHVTFEMEFAEPFDPTARTRQLTGSLWSWQPKVPGSVPDLLSLAKRELEFDRFEGEARPVLSAEAGHGDGLLFLNGGFSYWASSRGRLTALRPGCSPVSGYVDAEDKLFVACAAQSGATRIEELPSGAARLQLPPAAHFRDPSRPGMAFFPPGSPVFSNADAIAVARSGKPRVLRLPPGEEPPTTDNPAWILSDDGAPVELAPWATLEPATSPACAHAGGYRAIVQTGRAWLSVQGSSGFRPRTGMTALVRWSPERVCLEAVEVGFTELERRDAQALRVLAVARFVGPEPGAAFVATESSSAVREPATCELVRGVDARP